MEVAGIIIIINNFLFKHLAWNFIKNFPVPMMVVVDIVIIIIEVLSTLSYIYIYIYTYIIHWLRASLPLMHEIVMLLRDFGI